MCETGQRISSPEVAPPVIPRGILGGGDGADRLEPVAVAEMGGGAKPGLAKDKTGD